MTIHKIYSVSKSFYLNVRPSFSQDSFQTTIKAEPVSSDAYMADDVHNYFREAACILAGKHCSVDLFLSSSPRFIIIHIKVCHLREAAVHQAVGIPEVVVPYIIPSLQMPSDDRRGHAAFLITPTEVMLLFSMLSVYVRKTTLIQCVAFAHGPVPRRTRSCYCPKKEKVRAVKWMWAISFTSVAL